MTKRIFSIVTMTAALALYTPFFVTASAAQMKARIPFNFVVSGSAMPPGFYSLSTHNAYLILRGSTKNVAVLTAPATPRPAGAVEVVFRKTDDRYELIEVWMGGAGFAPVQGHGSGDDKRQTARATGERIVIAGM